jgi:hypothetical protein
MPARRYAHAVRLEQVCIKPRGALDVVNWNDDAIQAWRYRHLLILRRPLTAASASPSSFIERRYSGLRATMAAFLAAFARSMNG